MLFGLLFSKKELQEHGAREYIRGVTKTAEEFRAEHIQLDAKEARILDSQNSIKRMKDDLELEKAKIILNGLKEIFGNGKKE